MTKLAGASAERIAEEFVSSLFESEYGKSAHIRRITSWIGLIVLGIDHAKDDWHMLKWNLHFTSKRKHFRTGFKHDIGRGGGIAIWEILPGPGAPAGRTVAEITNLSEAEAFYQNASSILK